jgi:hypothetical protein
LFDDGKETVVPRITLQSLSPWIQIESLVIDAFIEVMNEEERSKLKKEKRRYYLPLGATINI